MSGNAQAPPMGMGMPTSPQGMGLPGQAAFQQPGMMQQPNFGGGPGGMGGMPPIQGGPPQLANQMGNMNLNQQNMPPIGMGGMPDFQNQNQPSEFLPSNPLDKFGQGNRNDVFGGGPPDHNVFGGHPDEQPMDVFQKPPPVKMEPPKPTGPINVDDIVPSAYGGGGNN